MVAAGIRAGFIAFEIAFPFPTRPSSSEICTAAGAAAFGVVAESPLTEDDFGA
jgi:hypothetical protein